MRTSSTKFEEKN
jgi:hypothetical protein